MDEIRFLTIKNNYESEIIIEKSRFICVLQRVQSEQEAKDFIVAMKKQHREANHNCSAYIIGEKSQFQKASDDGEPSGTAGVPMLEVLKKKGITDVVAVVTRYFGGIKLGAGGLIRAYGKSVSTALENAGLLAIKETLVTTIQVDYAAVSKIESQIGKTAFTILKSEYIENVLLSISSSPNQKEELKHFLMDLTAGKVVFVSEKIELVEIEYSDV